MPGMRWSDSSSATGSLRSTSWRSVSSALWPEFGAQDAVVLAKMLAQIALDSAQHARVVVYGKDYGLSHSLS